MTYPFAALVCLTCAALAIAASSGDADRGQVVFENRCAGCHEVDGLRIGPPLHRVYGHKAGRDPHFPYSEGFRRASIKWDDATLERWLTDPDSVIPGNEMAFRMGDPVERAAVIAWLRRLAEK